MNNIQKLPGDGSSISRVRTGPWVNPLLAAAKRDRSMLQAVDILGHPVNILGAPVDILGNVVILGSPETHITGGRSIAPIVDPMVHETIRPMFRPMVRLMGQTTIGQRRWGNRSLWEGTPIAQLVPAGLGEPFDQSYDISELIAGVDALGWEWDFKADVLKAYVRTSRGTSTVTIPGKTVKAIMLRAFHEAYGILAPKRFRRQATCGDLFSDIGNFFTKEIPKAVNSAGKWIEGAAKDIAKVAEDVVNNVISSEVFAGVMGAIAVIPPLTAVGGIGLAAYGVAKTAKAVIGVAKSVAAVVPKGSAPPPKPGAPKPNSRSTTPLTAAEVQALVSTRTFQAWLKQPATIQAARAPRLKNAGIQPFQAIVGVRLEVLANQWGWNKGKGKLKIPERELPTKPQAQTVATIGPNRVPVKVATKKQAPVVKPKVVPKRTEVKIENALEQLTTRVAAIAREDSPWARLLIAGMQTV